MREIKINEENIFEKLIEELSYEERLILKSKLENTLNVHNDAQIEAIDKNNERKLEKYIGGYKVSWFQKIIYYIISLIKNVSYKEFLISRIEMDIKNKLAKCKPRFYKKNTDTITILFYNIISEFYGFYQKYSDIINKVRNIFNNEDENNKFIFYLVKNNLDKTLTKKIKFFERSNIKDFILNNKDYKSKLSEHKKVFEKEVLFSLKEKIEPLYNFIYSFFKFFDIDFNQFFLAVKSQRNPENVKVKDISFFLIKFYKSVNSIPVENVDMIDVLNEALYYIKKIDEKYTFDNDDLELFFKNVTKLQSSKSLELLLKIALSNPVATYPSIRYSIEIKKNFYSYFDKYFKDLIFDLENEIRIEKKQSVYKQLDMENFEYYNLKHLNKNFINILKKYSLPSLNNFENFYILSSFYYTKWNKEFRNMLQNIIAFKYYILPSKHIARLNDIFMDIDALDYELNNIDNETQKLLLNIKNTFKNIDQLSDKSLLGIIQAEIGKIDMLIDNFNKSFYEKIVEVTNILNYNKSDSDVLKLLTALKLWENIFRILFF